MSGGVGLIEILFAPLFISSERAISIIIMARP